VATPTSSTAYSFATVGPIVSPRLGAWVIIPLAPHGTCHGSFVWSGEQTMTVDVLHPGGQVAVALDGPRRNGNPRRHDQPDRYAADCAVAGSGSSRGTVAVRQRAAVRPGTGPLRCSTSDHPAPRLASVYRPPAKASGCDAGAHTSRRRG
jgi:hypothetical protein